MPRPYADIAQALALCDALTHKALWDKADLLAEALDGGAKAKEIAPEAGCSASYVRQLAAIARAFPESHRHPTLTVSFYLAAVKASNPCEWVDRAHDNNWSLAELKEALGDTPEPQDDAVAKRAARSAERFVKAAGKRWGAASAEVHMTVGDEEVERKWPE